MGSASLLARAATRGQAAARAAAAAAAAASRTSRSPAGRLVLAVLFANGDAAELPPQLLRLRPLRLELGEELQVRLHVQLRRLHRCPRTHQHHLLLVLVDIEPRHLGLVLQVLEIAPTTSDQPSDLLFLHWHSDGDELEQLARCLDAILRWADDDDERL